MKRRKSAKIVPVDNDEALTGRLPINDLPRLVGKLPAIDIAKSTSSNRKAQLPPLKGRALDSTIPQGMGRGLDMAILGKPVAVPQSEGEEEEQVTISDRQASGEPKSSGSDETESMEEDRNTIHVEEKKEQALLEPSEKGDGPKHIENNTKNEPYYG